MNVLSHFIEADQAHMKVAAHSGAPSRLCMAQQCVVPDIQHRRGSADASFAAHQPPSPVPQPIELGEWPIVPAAGTRDPRVVPTVASRALSRGSVRLLSREGRRLGDTQCIDDDPERCRTATIAAAQQPLAQLDRQGLVRDGALPPLPHEARPPHRRRPSRSGSTSTSRSPSPLHRGLTCLSSRGSLCASPGTCTPPNHRHALPPSPPPHQRSALRGQSRAAAPRAFSPLHHGLSRLSRDRIRPDSCCSDSSPGVGHQPHTEQTPLLRSPVRGAHGYEDDDGRRGACGSGGRATDAAAGHEKASATLGLTPSPPPSAPASQSEARRARLVASPHAAPTLDEDADSCANAPSQERCVEYSDATQTRHKVSTEVGRGFCNSSDIDRNKGLSTATGISDSDNNRSSIDHSTIVNAHRTASKTTLIEYEEENRDNGPFCSDHATRRSDAAHCGVAQQDTHDIKCHDNPQKLGETVVVDSSTALEATYTILPGSMVAATSAQCERAADGWRDCGSRGAECVSVVPRSDTGARHQHRAVAEEDVAAVANAIVPDAAMMRHLLGRRHRYAAAAGAHWRGCADRDQALVWLVEHHSLKADGVGVCSVMDAFVTERGEAMSWPVTLQLLEELSLYLKSNQKEVRKRAEVIVGAILRRAHYRLRANEHAHHRTRDEWEEYATENLRIRSAIMPIRALLNQMAIDREEEGKERTKHGNMKKV